MFVSLLCFNGLHFTTSYDAIDILFVRSLELDMCSMQSVSSVFNRFSSRLSRYRKDIAPAKVDRLQKISIFKKLRSTMYEMTSNIHVWKLLCSFLWRVYRRSSFAIFQHQCIACSGITEKKKKIVKMKSIKFQINK